MITVAQIIAARKLLGWLPSKIALKADLPISAINRAEQSGIAAVADLAAIQQVLEAAGVEFTNGEQPGVRMKAQG